MRVHVFASSGAVRRSSNIQTRILHILDALAHDTNTQGLIVAVYLLRRRDFWQAHAYTDTVTPAAFIRTGKEWAFVQRFQIPPGLPERFQLIRMAFGMLAPYPRTLTDVYDWELRCDRFEDLLAYTFAHELHHFRRYHLGLHPGEGEQSACRWALETAAKAGFSAQGTRLRPRRKRRKRTRKEVHLPADMNPGLLRRIKLSASHLSLEDLRDLNKWIRDRMAAATRRPERSRLAQHFERLRSLPQGAELLIIRDNGRGAYLGRTAVKVRNLRRNSYRLSVRTPDGKEWHWPMQWLKSLKSEPL